MVVVGRPINGITINGLEYILDDDGNVMEFDLEEEAVKFLTDHGISEEEISYLVLMELQRKGA